MGLEQAERALCTDLYQLTMAAAYHDLNMTRRAAFEMFVRQLPHDRSYMLCAGLEQVVSYLQDLRFTSTQIDYIRSLPDFDGISDDFTDYLADFRFTGTVFAMPEGTVAFADEPLLRVEAPIIEAQIVETFLLSQINYQTLVATKAARVVRSAELDGRGRLVADFGTRRAHGPDAGVLAARACYIAGCASSSNVEAGFRLGMPVSGTEAHSFIMAFDHEEDAFQGYCRCFGEKSILLIDTYDVIEGARAAVRSCPKMRGVRIDSGDLESLGRKVRRILDEAGLEDAIIVGSGDLDEYAIADLVRAGAPYDAFGVGTKMVTSEDAAALGGVYKLVAVEKNGHWEPRCKFSAEKATYPGPKQVFRFHETASGAFLRDVIASADEDCPPQAEPLLQTVMKDGRLTEEPPELEEIRERAAEQLRRLPDEYQRLHEPDDYPVSVSRRLEGVLRSFEEQWEEGRE